MKLTARITRNLVGMALGSGLIVALVWLTSGQGIRPPAPSPTPVEVVEQAAPVHSPDAADEQDCRPCQNDARLTCCFPAHTVELDEASKRLLNFAFNLEGIVGEHDRLFQVAADRLRACDRRAADAGARIAGLEDQVRDLALDVRELQRARKRRR